MPYENPLSRYIRKREHQQRLARRIAYRQDIRQMEDSSKRLQKLIDAYSQQAVDAEKNGQHDKAVKLAAQVQHLRTFQNSAGGVRNTIETVHAMNAASQAMTDILSTTGGLADSIAEMNDPAALAEAQYGMEEAAESMQMLQEQSEMMYESMHTESQPDEAGEAYLKKLMEGSRKKKQTSFLADTNKQLDRLQRARPVD